MDKLLNKLFIILCFAFKMEYTIADLAGVVMI